MYIIFFKFWDLRKWTPAWVVPFLLAMDWTNFSNFWELSLIEITFWKRWIISLSFNFELGEIFAKEALERSESCWGHFREESQSKEGEALRDDKNFTFVSAWEYNGEPSNALLHKEDLKYENIELKTRSYK